jgi:S-adenosylmethionine hydrolase
VFLCVVDPGVGTERGAMVLEADGRWFVGPENGLLDVAAGAASGVVRAWRIRWRPERLSATFHGRDLFAPVAGAIAAGTFQPREWEGDGRVERFGYAPGPPADLYEVVYVDHFGNAMTGIRTGVLGASETLRCRERRFRFARTFGEAAPGEGLWFGNSNGLVEIALNRASLADRDGVAVGDPIRRG